NGKRCESRQFLQCDHITPHSICGETAQDNMRILCSEHNKLAYQKFSCLPLSRSFQASDNPVVCMSSLN
ncbi:MAG: HNH endonuclease, partial [Bdellovibrio sp.]|nr:HNH endonuclease [Bdellovibrio sp.]